MKWIVTESAWWSPSGENSVRFAFGMTTGSFVSSSIVFGRRIVRCALPRWIWTRYVPSGACVPASVLPSQRKMFRPRRTGVPSTSVRTGFRPAVSTVTVAVSFFRNLTLMLALSRAQPQTGENALETKVPVIGLFSSFSFSVMAKAAAVPMSRPTTVNVERSRCKADGFYVGEPVVLPRTPSL